MRNPAERLRDILDAIDRILSKCGTRSAFGSDELLQIWAVHHLQIIGEASRSLPDEFRTRHPEVSWQRIIGMRHILVHHYFDIDVDIVWSVIANELPSLRAQMAILFVAIENTMD